MGKEKIAIIGMGIAGAILSHNLLIEDCDLTIFNKTSAACSSRVAAGMYNSIIPRRVTKSWLSDELNPIINSYYPALERELNASFFNPKEILHLFEYPSEQKEWLKKVKKVKFAGYFEEDAHIFPTNPLLNSPLGGLYIKQGGYCHTHIMLDAFEVFFKKLGIYEDALINSHEIELVNGKYKIQGKEFDKVIFCEGVANSNNKWFHKLPFKFAKGELLHVKIEGLDLMEILLGGVFLVPWGGKDEYLLGSTFEWDFPDALPTEGAKEKLLTRIRDYIPTATIEVLEHRAGIRPAVIDRKPLIGEHPEEKGIYIFNGFGSKAISLAPYFAKQMLDFLCGNGEIQEEVHVKRFSC